MNFKAILASVVDERIQKLESLNKFKSKIPTETIIESLTLTNEVEENQKFKLLTWAIVSLFGVTNKVIDAMNIMNESMKEIVNKHNFLEEKISIIEMLVQSVDDKLQKLKDITELPNFKKIEDKIRVQNLVIKSFTEINIKVFKSLNEIHNFQEDLFKNVKKLESKWNENQKQRGVILMQVDNLKNSIIKTEDSLKKISENEKLFELVIRDLKQYIKKDYQIKDVENKIELIDEKLNFCFQKEIKNNFFSYWSFLPMLLINIRRIPDKDYILAVKKINKIYELLNKFNPLIVCLIDIGRQIEWNLKNYNVYYSKNNQNCVIIHKAMKQKIEYINEDAIMINDKIICFYYKPQDQTSKWNTVLNFANYIMAGDLNFASHNNMKEPRDKRKLYYMIHNKKIYYEETKQCCIVNIKYTKKKERKNYKYRSYDFRS